MLAMYLLANHCQRQCNDSSLFANEQDQMSALKVYGLWLYYKSLAEEKFRWPCRGEAVVSLTGQQINWLLAGHDIALMQGHKKLRYKSVF